MTAAAYEFDDSPGPVKELVSQSLREFRKTLIRAARLAIDAGQLHADTDAEQLAFEICGIYAGAQLDARLFGDPEAGRRALLAFGALLARHGGSDAFAQSGVVASLAPETPGAAAHAGTH